MTTFVAPEIPWASLVPLLIIFGSAIAGVFVAAFWPVRNRRTVQVFLLLVAPIAALVTLIWRWQVVITDGNDRVLVHQLAEDGTTIAVQCIVLIIAIVGFAVLASRLPDGESPFTAQGASSPGTDYEEAAQRAGLEQTEVFTLALFSLGGMLVFPMANDLLILFVALEVLSLPLYVLTAMARRRRVLSHEAALKYFLLGAFSSALLLMGIALLYGFSGSLELADIGQAAAAMVGMDGVAVVGFLLVLVGLLFKVGAVPFHAWMPDVYQGAPTPVTGFMAAATKIAAFGAILRLLYVAAPGFVWDIQPALWATAIASMVYGTVVALVQTNVKRILAYSSIAHAGFALVAVIGLSAAGGPALLFYVLAYGVATVGAFAVVGLVRERDAEGNVTGEALEIDQWRGLGRRHPWLAGAMTLFLLSFAGIPLTGGFVGKFLAFAAAADGGAWPIVVVAVVASAAAAYIYIRIIVVMFFSVPARPGEALAALLAADDAAGAGAGEGALGGGGVATATATATAVVPAQSLREAVAVRPSILTACALWVCALGTFFLGFFPGPVVDLLQQAVRFVV